MNLARHVRPRDVCLSVVLGDFNYVEHDQDRYNLDLKAFVGHTQNAEAVFLRQQVWEVHGFTPLDLEAYTNRRGNTCATLE